MKPSRSARACLCVGFVLLFNTRVESQENSSSITMIPVSSDQVSNRSRYYNQVEFITDFLLNSAGNITTYSSDFTMPPSDNIQEPNETFPSKNSIDGYTNQNNVETNSSRDNNTTTNDLQLIPAVFSSVLDTLPVHPRIPRRSVAKRKTRVRLNRHSTRVNTDLPVRFLLPPPINKHKCASNVTPKPPFQIKPIIISSSTPLIPISAVATPNDYLVVAKPLQVKSEQKESLINEPLKRRIFVPPPPRHLLPPPFSHENHLNYHHTTPQSSLPERNSIEPYSPQNENESSTKQQDCDKTKRIESSSLIPIVVVEDTREINNWDSQNSPFPPVNSPPYQDPVRNVELLNGNEPIRNMEPFSSFPPSDYHNQLASTTSENPPVYENLNIHYHDQKNEHQAKICDKNHSISDDQHLHSDNFLPNDPQQLDFNNQPLPANNQIFYPNIQDSSQSNKKPIIPNIPQKYTPNNQQPFNQLQSRPSNQNSLNNQYHFNQDYQPSLSVDNQQTLSTNNAQEFKFNNAPSISNHDRTQNKPLCNESNQKQFPPDSGYSPKQYPSDKQNSQQQFNPNLQLNEQQFPSDRQYSQQQLSPNNQYNQQQFSLDKQFNKQLPSDNQYNPQPFTSDSQYSQQQSKPDSQNKQLFPSDNQQQYPLKKHYNHQQQSNLNHQYNHKQFPTDKQYNQQQLNPDNQQQYILNHQYQQPEVSPIDEHNFSPSDQVQFSQTSATDISVTREPGPFTSFKSSPFEHYSLKPTTPLPLSSSIEPYPILRGPNIEQTLFDTGNFQVGDTPFNNTNDSTVAMMNRPLLTQEIARMGMKITANLKMEQINKAKFDRGKYKYNHLNQFNFPNLDGPSRSNEVSKSSNLLVAETAYYKDRRGVQELTETAADLSVIPGTPGVDYPTLDQPPLKSEFSCRSVENHRGYVADPSTRCQVFYICVGSGPGEAMLCPNGTLFSQDFLVCDWWFNIDCQPYS